MIDYFTSWKKTWLKKHLFLLAYISSILALEQKISGDFLSAEQIFDKIYTLGVLEWVEQVQITSLRI